jgi:ion channel-forming bestrophin family protein
MIVRDKPHLIQLFFTLRGSIIPSIFPQIVLITLLGAVVALTQAYFPAVFPSFTLAPLALFGVALSLFLGFRNNASYDRWWEARKHWGQLVVDARSLSRQLTSYLAIADSTNANSTKQDNNATRVNNDSQDNREIIQRMIKLIIAFTHALRHHLRQTDPWPDISRYLPNSELTRIQQSKNIPDAILRLLGDNLAQCRQQGLLSDILITCLDERITSMALVQAACERIKNTPLPFAYMLLVHRTAYLYCFILPFGIVASQGLFTPVFSAIVAYTFFGLDALSEELEEPFGMAANDLALSAMSRSIEINLLEILGETELPEPLLPHNYLLQ